MLQELIECMRMAACEIFTKSDKVGYVQEWQQIKEHKQRLLRVRSELRASMADKQEEALKQCWSFWRVQHELHKQTIAIKEIVKEQNRLRQAHLEKEVEMHWNSRNLRRAWATVRAATGTKRGAARRWGDATLSSQPDAARVLELLQKPSGEGGWSATRCTEYIAATVE
jgi:hypothetical protein